MSTTPRTDESTLEAFCRFDQGGICDAETRGQRDGRFVEADFARQLETELSSLQLELGATKGELNEAKAEIERMKTRDMWLSGLSDDIQDVRGKLVESQAREAQLREALEFTLNGIQEWCDDVDSDASWDGWDSNFKYWKFDGIKKLEQLLAQHS